MKNSLLAIFHEIICTILWPNFWATSKFIKNSILIGINSNFLCNINRHICIKKIIKMENSLLAIFL